jgi:potassium/hydrogen antiporter
MPCGERLLVAWAGLKGAVPILLGVFIVQSGLPQGRKLYEIIFVVVAFSVIVQGGTPPALLRRFRVPLRPVEPGASSRLTLTPCCRMATRRC